MTRHRDQSESSFEHRIEFRDVVVSHRSTSPAGHMVSPTVKRACLVSEPKKRKRDIKEDVWQCLGKTKSGQPCRNTLRAKEHYKFCRLHRAQANDMPCKTFDLPNEILYKVIDYLQPHERVALALTNRNLAAVVKARNKQGQSPLRSTSQVLVRRHSDIPIGFVTDVLVKQGRPMYRMDCPGYKKWDYAMLSHISQYSICVSPCKTCESTEFRGPFAPILRAPLLGLHGNCWKSYTLRPTLRPTFEAKTIRQTTKDHSYLFGKHRRCLGCHNPFSQKHCKASRWFCRSCEDQYEYYLRWCQKCKGSPGPLDIARIWWQAQENCLNAKLRKRQ